MKKLKIAIVSIILVMAIGVGTFSFLTLKNGNVTVTVNADKTGDTVPNIVDNVNLWAMGESFYDPKITSDCNVFEFVEYVQLMQCTGGTEDRDLFIDPLDTSTMTDYDFEPLIKNCAGILKLGAKPHLKLGGVPLKFTKDYEMGGFGMNPYPPDDYNVYYDYINAIAKALVKEFGLEEVKSWRFGVMTEYENKEWFKAKIKTDNEEELAKASAEEYCKLYDYTVKALTDVLGDDICVGAHSMTVTEGLWDEEIFIKHVAEGENYATGETGTPIKFLSASFYDNCPGEYTGGKTLPETIGYLKNLAEKYGLNDLFYGIDEGRLLNGNSSGTVGRELVQRVTGYTWQASYDARLFKQGIDNGLNYFSSWGFLSNGLMDGYPTVSYHVADNLSKFSGSKILETTQESSLALDVEADCLAVWNEETQTLRVMVYNFKNDVDFNNELEVNLTLNVSQFDGKAVKITKSLINDDCNYFDEWQEDRKTYNITDDKFCWSPDDPSLDNPTTLADEDTISFYRENLRDKYIECSKLTPAETTETVKDGILTINETIEAGNVVFYEIKH